MPEEGLNEFELMQLGGWSTIAMVRRYAKVHVVKLSPTDRQRTTPYPTYAWRKKEERFYMKLMYWLVVVVLAVLYVKYYHVIGPRLLLMLAGLYAAAYRLLATQTRKRRSVRSMPNTRSSTMTKTYSHRPLNPA